MQLRKSIGKVREKKHSEETIETTYDNIVDELYPYKEPLERLVMAAKRMAVLAGIVAVCLYVTVAGEKDRLPEPKQILNISVIDKLPPENELELRVLGEDYWKTVNGHGNASVRHVLNEDSFYLRQEDGTVREESGCFIQMDTVQFFVPEEDLHNRRQRDFDREELRYTTHLYGVGERYLEYHEFNDTCSDFNFGIDSVRKLVREGYLNERITDYLFDLYPKINPHERKYTLQLMGAGETLMEGNQDRWWHVEYDLYTKADTGEELLLVSIYISRDILEQGQPQGDDARYRIEPSTGSLWQLMENPAKDMGDVWLQKIEGDTLSSEESVRRFVEERGAAFLLPEGVDAKIDWNCRRQEEFYYDYLVWQGETANYEVTLAIPLMEKQNEGYYLASVIRREAEDKAACHHILSGMMQTFWGIDYLHVVKEGESLCRIAEKYMGSQGLYASLQMYDEEEGAFIAYSDIDNPDLIYPGQKVYVPLDGFEPYFPELQDGE